MKIKFCVARDLPGDELLINFENMLDLGIISTIIKIWATQGLQTMKTKKKTKKKMSSKRTSMDSESGR